MTTLSSKSRGAGAALALLLTSLVCRQAGAQTTPKFEYGKAEVVKTVEWKAQAKGGVLVTGGNSSTANGTVGFSASRKEGSNKLALEGAFAYGTSRIYDVTSTPDAVDPTKQVITAMTPRDAESTNNWLAKARYDRFFTPNNAGYVTALTGGDKIAGKTFVGGGQIGYSRQLLANDKHLLVAELGYDLSYERYVQPRDKPAVDPVTIHSARVFVGETLKLAPQTGLSGSVEALFNLNKEGGALNAKSTTNMKGVDAFADTRFIGKLGVTTTLVKSLSVGLGYTLKYDQNPAPRPVPASAPKGAVFGPAFNPFAETTDQLFEATLVYTFL
ncbi:MAG: hypothetical protein JWM82_3231 [Myxococcales bacterium]|nr:hypothetical protein [Myxococcales bacterium]